MYWTTVKQKNLTKVNPNKIRHLARYSVRCIFYETINNVA